MDEGGAELTYPHLRAEGGLEDGAGESGHGVDSRQLLRQRHETCQDEGLAQRSKHNSHGF